MLGTKLSQKPAGIYPSFEEYVEKTMEEVMRATSKIDPDEVTAFCDAIRGKAGKKIYIIGEGRSGLIGKMFAQRLSHLGFEKVYAYGDTVIPAISAEDLVIAISGSGETDNTCNMARKAKEIGAYVVAVTSFPNSTLGNIAEQVVHVPGRTKISRAVSYDARQLAGEHEPLNPLGTIFELTAHLFLDQIINMVAVADNLLEDGVRRHHIQDWKT